MPNKLAITPSRSGSAPAATSEPGDGSPLEERPGQSISITVELRLDLMLLRRQKSALIGVAEGATVSHEQEEAAEGLLNLLDFIQDAVVEEGLATEDEVFPRMPQLFDPSTSSVVQA